MSRSKLSATRFTPFWKAQTIAWQFFFVRRPTRVSRSIMVGSLLTGIAATWYVFASTAAGVDAADALVPPPAWADWTGWGLIAMALSAAAFVGAVLRRPPDASPSPRDR